MSIMRRWISLRCGGFVAGFLGSDRGGEACGTEPEQVGDLAAGEARRERLAGRVESFGVVGVGL